MVFRRDFSGVPSQRIRPLVGSIIRLTIRSVVVLPQPDGPTITVILPDGTVEGQVDHCGGAVAEGLAH